MTATRLPHTPTGRQISEWLGPEFGDEIREGILRVESEARKSDQELLWDIHFWLTDAPNAKDEAEIRALLTRALAAAAA